MKKIFLLVAAVSVTILFAGCEGDSSTKNGGNNQNPIVGTWRQNGTNGHFEQMVLSSNGKISESSTSGGNIYEYSGTYSFTQGEGSSAGVLIWQAGGRTIERYVLSLSDEFMLLATVKQGATSGYLYTGTFTKVASSSASGSISCDPTSIQDSGNGDSYTINVNTSSSWKATSSQDWITVSPTTGIGNGTVNVTITSGVTAEGYIKFTNSYNTVTVTVKRTRNNGATGKENGHEYVDLGLSVKWATCNLGAELPEEYGSYYAWGEVCPKKTYTTKTYEYINQKTGLISKYCTKSQCGKVDNKTVLELSDDAAYANWRGRWRMPTEAEISELLNNTTRVWTYLNGVVGCRFTSKKAGYSTASIFLPAAGTKQTLTSSAGTWGIYWSSTLSTTSPNEYNARDLEFTKSMAKGDAYPREYGLVIRPVFK